MGFLRPRANPITICGVYLIVAKDFGAGVVFLYEELKREDIRVSILCPGPVITNEEGLRRYYAQGWKAKLIIKMPEEIARVAIPAMLRGKAIIIPGFLPWLFTKILNFIPELLKMRILERIFRVYKEIPTPKSD